MIITQTPLRISFLGGGTDFPSFIEEEGGTNVLTSTIDKYIFVIIKQRFDEKIRIGYTNTEIVDQPEELKHELIREALVLTGLRSGVEITTMGDIPGAGSGLGSSSAVTVGVLNAIYHYQGQMLPAETLARQACHIELDVLNKPIGIQDQYGTALGGLRFTEFHPDGKVVSELVELDPRLKRRLNESLLLFYTGIPRQAATILAQHKENLQSQVALLYRVKALACMARDELQHGNLDVIGELLHESWMIKKQMASKASNEAIDTMYAAARAAGATGGKLTGAGGGGFLLLYCPYERREAVRDALDGLRELPFSLEPDGTKVIFNYRR